jgi:Sap, sulfolipid-1-addressing protein
MSTEALVLAITTVIRPTSVAAVLAMLAASRPHRLLVAYILGGLAFSFAVGTLVVVLLGGLRSAGLSSGVRPLLDLLLGACALVYAAITVLGGGPRTGPDGGGTEDGWMRRRLTNLSPAGAATAGVLTHLPGVVYLAALNAIAHSATGIADGLLQVVVYNAIWFSLAVAALVLSVYRPALPRQLIERTVSVVRRRQQMLIVCFCGGLGGYLFVVGLQGLASVAS